VPCAAIDHNLQSNHVVVVVDARVVARRRRVTATTRSTPNGNGSNNRII